VKDVVVSIDIGTSKVCTMIGNVGKDSRLSITGKGLSACQGLKKGIIVDVEDTASSISASLEEAERAADLKVSSAYVNIHGAHVNVINNSASIVVSSENKEITRSDVEKVLYEVSNVEIADDCQIIDVVPKQFIVDGYDEILDPVGMVGSRLEIDAEIVMGKITSVQNIVRSMEKAGLKIDGIIAEALGTGELVLSQEEKEAGVILIDVGGNITNISIFKNKNLIFYDSIPVGGYHITNDISIGLKISCSEAEKIKRQYELALTTLIQNDQELSVFDITENHKKNVRISEIVEIIESRVFEIFTLCKMQAERSEALQNYPGGVVLTGAGISYVDGNKEIVEEVFEMPVRVAKIRHMDFNKPEYYSAAGMIKYVSSTRKPSSSVSELKQNKSIYDSDGEGFLKSIFNKLSKIFRELF
jgi:cell division protein FtsA